MDKRFFILGKYNTWADWGLLLTFKQIPDPEPKLYQVDIDGQDGALDLSEALTGEVVYNPRTVEASFSASEGTYAERDALLREIVAALHGRQVQIIEPDDPDHYMLGRVQITDKTNAPSHATLAMEATCDPWRYALEETTRTVAVSAPVDVVIHNHGTKTLTPRVAVSGTVALTYDGVTTELTDGTYKLSGLKLRAGANVIGLAGSGTVAISYREAVL